MHVWLIESGEPLPIDDKAQSRLWRIGLLSERLAQRGHNVVWWASTFDHFHKRQRFDVTKTININPNFRLILLHGPPYHKNISFRRIRNHRVIAGKFIRLADQMVKPDIIHCCLPTIEFCDAATSFGRAHGIPVVLDIRDMWPDIMVEIFPQYLLSLARFILYFYFKSVSRSCQRATAICAMSQKFVEKGLNYAKRSSSPLDKAFPFGYANKLPYADLITSAELFWKAKLNKWKNSTISPIVACFIGSFTPRIELQTVILAARILDKLKKPIYFVICGKGEYETTLKNMAEGLDNIIFPGWIGEAEILVLMKYAHIGLLPYPSTEDFSASIPNKVVEYLAGSLPVLSSVKGVVEELLRSYKCGITYPNDDPQSLAETLIKVHSEREKLNAMSSNAGTLFREKFTADKVYGEMCDHLEIIVKRKSY